MSKKIEIPSPDWNSDLANIILDLEKLRTKRLGGEIPAHIFFQLKFIFQIMETLGSARIEGNNTTLSEYVEKIIEDDATVDEKHQELSNIEDAISFIEDNTDEETKINRAYISELHKIVTYKLSPPPKGEGSKYPGALRKHNVKIGKSDHKPPSHELLQDNFEEFVDFINKTRLEQNQLLAVAIAHHRFMYIHPFDNGNGRMGRLLNYAFLIKLGFNVKAGRIVNPSSVFYADRDQYYDMLAKADSLKTESILAWSEYFLNGLRNQIEKIDSLTQRDFTQNNILLPAIATALDRKHITDQEAEILRFMIKSPKMSIKSAELSKIGITETAQKTYLMKKLRDKKMVRPTEEGGRIYTVRFINSYLLRGVTQALNENGFVAEFLNKN